MSSLWPAPLLSSALLVVWLLLSDSAQPGSVLLGLVLAALLPICLGHRAGRLPTTYQLQVLLRLGGRVAVDIVRSNIELAVRILGPESALRPHYVWVPVTLEHPVAISILASIITLTPGTVSADLSPGGRYLLVHAFDVDDDADLISQIQTRYETPLKAIFR